MKAAHTLANSKSPREIQLPRPKSKIDYRTIINCSKEPVIIEGVRINIMDTGSWICTDGATWTLDSFMTYGGKAPRSQAIGRVMHRGHEVKFLTLESEGLLRELIRYEACIARDKQQKK